MSSKIASVIVALGLAGGAVLAQGAKPTDPQIAHIAYTAGSIDIDAAKQALQMSKNADVRAFAEQMVKDHEAVNKQALALCKKLNVTPEDNDTSKSLAKAAKAKRDRAREALGRGVRQGVHRERSRVPQDRQRRARQRR